jgi:hypothetical protein
MDSEMSAQAVKGLERLATFVTFMYVVLIGFWIADFYFVLMCCLLMAS